LTANIDIVDILNDSVNKKKRRW